MCRKEFESLNFDLHTPKNYYRHDLQATQERLKKVLTNESRRLNNFNPCINIFTGSINTSYAVILNLSVNDTALGDNFYSASSPAENTTYSTTDFTDWTAPNTTYNFTVYFAGDTNYTSDSEILYFHVHDTTAPTYSNPQNNTSLAGTPCNFTLDWTDEASLAGHIFSTNNSGTWKNSSFVSFSGTSNTSWNVGTCSCLYKPFSTS